jgi:deazaflavin-dependent oxidoreductase (nitroreductase family)
MPKPDGAFGRFMQRLSSSPRFAKIAPHVVPPMDRFIHRITGGRVVMSSGMLPILVLTTTGAKTGQERTSPLATLPNKEDGTFLVVGSNFGRESHPAWTANLLKTPDASISFKGDDIPVTAHLLTNEEKAEAWPLLTAMWPVFDNYVERSGRNLRVFRLEPKRT